ncbi:ABC transporter substrate-binding protein [Bradyrhizobium sp.]|jgi:putative ABC transport system substrate-binding protein|uniref:ABC transporter substrate-binding protein n=1 Tax=Bradyrhizobium sp. TaxID=376 RepID=UPI003C1EF54C
MQRRNFITLIGGAAAAWPLEARAQPTSAIKRVAVLMGLAETDAEGQARNKAFRSGFQQLGWIENANIQFDYYWDVNSNKRSDELAAVVMSKKVDVIFTNSPAGLAAAKKATRSIPIVFVQFTDPVEDGIVASLAHPGGNITGFASSEHVMSTKWLDLLRELAPRTTRVGFIQHVEHPSWQRYNRIIQEVASSFGFAAFPIGVRDATELEEGINKLSLIPGGSLLILPDTFNTINRKLIIASARQQNLPAVYPLSVFTKDGGLMSYGGDLVDLFKRAALYVDRILRGDKAGELPIQQATKFDLVVNLKTAKALGLDVPPTLLARADEVIE